jgi:hypothetical protein
MDYGKEDGHIESLDEHVQPRSLYLKQLEDRLGEKAVKSYLTQRREDAKKR